jgi:hypothetical protein
VSIRLLRNAENRTEVKDITFLPEDNSVKFKMEIENIATYYILNGNEIFIDNNQQSEMSEIRI